MSMNITTWIYLWPAAALFVMIIMAMIAVLIGVNLLLGLGVVSMYALTPKDVLFDSISQTCRNPMIETNIQNTFSMQVKYPLPPTAMYVWSPHALMSISAAMYNFGICKSPEYTPNHLVSLPMFHYIPVFSDIAKYIGSIPSDYHSIEKTLAKKESVSVLLGGVREMTMVEDYKIRLCIKKRRGIFRLAITSGTPLIPVLTFGENELFSQVSTPTINSFNKYLFKTFGMHVPIPTLHSLKNWIELSYRPLKPIRSYTGKPIPVTQKLNPTDKDIDDLRTKYIQGVRELFGETAGSEYSLHIE